MHAIHDSTSIMSVMLCISINYFTLQTLIVLFNTRLSNTIVHHIKLQRVRTWYKVHSQKCVYKTAIFIVMVQVALNGNDFSTKN